MYDPTVDTLKSCEILQLPKNERKSIFNLYVTGILWRTAEWNIRAAEEYYTQGWKRVFAAIKSSKVRNLVLDLNLRPSIIQHIVNIKFNQLKQLWLHGNQIQSIYVLTFLYAPKLKSISLSANRLTQVYSLAKCKYPDLTDLYIEGNRSLKYDKLERSNINKTRLFILEWDKKDPVVLQDASVLCKIKIEKKGLIRLNGKDRIKQQKVYKSLHQTNDQCRIIITN